VLKKIFIISLQKSAHRREYINKLFNHNHIEFEFFDAFDGSLHIQNNFEIKFNLTNGELGCLYSHLLLYKKIQKENISEALVLEDDIIFSKRFLIFYKNWLKNDKKTSFEILKLGYSDSQSFVYDRPIHVNIFTKRYFNKILIARPIEKSLGSFSYIITKSGSAKMIDVISTKLSPIDVLLHESPRYSIRFYVVLKQLVYPNFDFDSIIRNKHSHLMVTKKQKGKLELKHRLTIIKNSFLNYLNSNFNTHLND
jgi:glycosyl transferase family 25